MTKILGDGKIVNEIEIKNLKTNKINKIKLKAIFPYIGQIPNTQFLQNYPSLLNDEGFIILKPNSFQTAIPGIFAAGDVVIKNLRQVANAVGDGANVAQEAISFVDKIKENN